MTENLLNKIKILRERTGVGIKDCKNILLKTNGSLENAVIELRKLGVLKAESLVKREAKEGQIAAYISDDKKKGVLLELNSETDFVSRNEKFKSFAFEISKLAIDNSLSTKDSFMEFRLKNRTINESILDLSSFYGENIFIGKYKYIDVDNGFLVSYIHGIKTGKIGTLVNFLGDDHTLAYDIAIHIAAMNPLYLDYNSMPTSFIEREKNIFYSEVKNLYSKKDSIVLDKIVDGKLNKYFDSIILLRQSFVKSPNLSVENVIRNKIRILNYIKFEVGK